MNLEILVHCGSTQQYMYMCDEKYTFVEPSQGGDICEVVNEGNMKLRGAQTGCSYCNCMEIVWISGSWLNSHTLDRFTGSADNTWQHMKVEH